ncbi:hypothetical protein [Leifsonia sp. TF02-11]|uniref:hypothetical protein n=1 Tax=Leifsonia sp. TF02-11 TaxID=2815212 RepID=UPI001AA19A41|nr:hypothetical protein [Leifsonia sp. TF02-11]MBO1739426.1 hypothetical protein [Leifsonia sp. TF02-11]
MMVAGAGAVVAGICVVAFRRRVAVKNRENIESSVSEKAFPGLAAGSTPSRMVPVGVILMIAGVMVIGKAFVP